MTLLAAARAAGAFRILAHPFHPHTPWTDWKTSDFDGMEIWNEDAAWRQNNFFGLMDALLLYGENDQLALVRLASTPEENFAKWDELLQAAAGRGDLRRRHACPDTLGIRP